MRRFILKNGSFSAAALTLACAALSVLLVLYSPLAMQGAKEGLSLCGQVIIPSMYPFFVLAGIFAELGGSGRSLRKRKFLWAILRQPPAALGVILLGFLGGYPLGARAAAHMMEQGALTRPQAQRLLLFCVNAGPAYLIGAVGSALLGNRQAGVLLFVSTLTAGLVMGLLTRALPDQDAQDDALSIDRVQKERKGLDAVLLSSVTQATGSILGVCAWVVLFSALCALLRLLPQSMWSAIPALNVLLEVSSGAAAVIRAGLPLPVLCAALCWGGLSVHCQLLGDLRKTGLPLRLFWVSRILHGALAAAVCAGLLRLFPMELSAAAVRGSHIVRLWAVSAPAAAAILFFCAFLILDLDLNRKLT